MRAYRRNASNLSLPSLEKQQEIVDAIGPIEQDSKEFLVKAQRALKLAKEFRLRYLYKFFGPPTKLLKNPSVRFSQVIQLKNGDRDADFWITRSGQTHNVGRPFRRGDPEFIEMETEEEWQARPTYPVRGLGARGRAPRQGLDPRNHTGVTVLDRDLLLPEFLYYVAEFAWKSKIYQRLCVGSLPLQHIRHRDIMCALTTVLSQRKNPSLRRFRSRSDDGITVPDRCPKCGGRRNRIRRRYNPSDAFTLKSWSETPRTLIESLVWQAVLDGAETRPVNWKGATKEPFLTLEAQGGTKREHVTRLQSGGNVTVHVWISTDGTRSHLKIKTT